MGMNFSVVGIEPTIPTSNAEDRKLKIRRLLIIIYFKIYLQPLSSMTKKLIKQTCFHSYAISVLDL